MAKSFIVIFAFALMLTEQAQAVVGLKITDHNKTLMDHGNGHLMDMGGAMVMGNNTDKLPGSCEAISEEIEITVHAGHKYSKNLPGTMFAFDQQEWKIEPCSKVTVHFINEDKIRHQFMMHGLPKYIYKSGMFHLEVTGPGKISGSFIVPAKDETYLVHCDIAQHMEKGMKGQLIVGKGGTDIPSIPGRTPFALPDSYEMESGPIDPVVPITPGVLNGVGKQNSAGSFISGMSVIGLLFGLLGFRWLLTRYKGMTLVQIGEAVIQELKKLYSDMLLVKFKGKAISHIAQLVSAQAIIIMAWVKQQSGSFVQFIRQQLSKAST